MEQLINEPPLPRTPLERFQEHLSKPKRGKHWTFEEAFEQSVKEEIAMKLITQDGLSNGEIIEQSGASRAFVQDARVKMRRSGEYDMRRDLSVRKANWYNFLKRK
jgi:hypothetical protein